MSKHYICDICHGLNSAARLHCQNCGTTPAEYSIIGQPAILNEDAEYIAVKVARGAIRQELRHSRVYFRTVPLDYYASE